MIKINFSQEMNHHDSWGIYILPSTVINNRNHRSPLPLLWERCTTLPLEAVGGPIGALDEFGLKLEALATRAMVEGNGAEVEANVSCLLLYLHIIKIIAYIGFILINSTLCSPPLGSSPCLYLKSQSWSCNGISQHYIILMKLPMLNEWRVHFY